MNAFEEGYTFFAKQAGVQIAGYEGSIYVGKVDDEIAKLLQDLNAFDGFKTEPDSGSDPIFEFDQLVQLLLLRSLDYSHR